MALKNFHIFKVINSKWFKIPVTILYSALKKLGSHKDNKNIYFLGTCYVALLVASLVVYHYLLTLLYNFNYFIL